ncbi:hypothetical protein AB0G64_11105 [Streptomyces longwoodensis]|uniref:hypothetical protein n=1 Tax=Streptomyces longwoodensis TaxID=68231 RepID=UPI0033F5F429
MKPLALGAALAALWLLLGLPVALPSGVGALVGQPVILAFAAGALARPYLPRRRWSR